MYMENFNIITKPFIIITSYKERERGDGGLKEGNERRV